MTLSETSCDRQLLYFLTIEISLDLMAAMFSQYHVYYFTPGHQQFFYMSIHVMALIGLISDVNTISMESQY